MGNVIYMECLGLMHKSQKKLLEMNSTRMLCYKHT